MTGPFLLFDDSRKGTARLYERPVGEIVAIEADEVRAALGELRAAVADGRHAAGFIGYDACYGLESKLGPLARRGGAAPLLWFGLFDGFRELGSADVAALLGDPAAAWLGRPEPRISRDDYVAAAGRVRAHLFAGDFYQANLTFGCDVALSGPPLAAYAEIKRRSNAAWGGVARFPGGWLLSASPEQFFTLRDGLLEAKPMKGTAPRHDDPAADRAEADTLAADSKQRAENLMIVDLLRNDLARVAETGSVDVPELFAVESFPTVHQMVSRVTARLRGGLGPVDVLETLFPCGSITGAPKIAAIAALRALEPEPRGAYTGSMGWIAPNGDAAFNVLIRTLEWADGAGVARLGLGSGLVVDSVAGNEWDECLLKGKFVASDVQDFDLIETMRFDPHGGIAFLEEHLDRLGRAAEQFDFRFDRHGARNELQAATFRRSDPAMLRLLLSPKGSMAVELKPLPEAPRERVKVAVRPLPVASDDVRLRWKTTARAFLDEARREGGGYETVFVDGEGMVTEGSFTNVFVERGGRLATPPLSRGLMPGLLRARLIAEGKAVEAEVSEADLAGGFLIGNSVRGLIRAELA
ncbi:aminodeoxychorismate synthase component I [Sphingomonas mesophila]|uniref:aminodeoxychorismate synthase component I n=1 Tax=Sphingomonas mesophila TaxID=2303576 RepID=UPI000E5674A6|nr:aminodeoxychorismate synthase component I [Sphingomonas mesophila]